MSTTATPEDGRYTLTLSQIVDIEHAGVVMEEAASLLYGLTRHNGETVFEPSCLGLIAEALSRAHTALTKAIEAGAEA